MVIGTGGMLRALPESLYQQRMLSLFLKICWYSYGITMGRDGQFLFLVVFWDGFSPYRGERLSVAGTQFMFTGLEGREQYEED
ncbi:MAG: hypothetical protein ACRCZU_11120 [Selenomonadaceae bacterium]